MTVPTYRTATSTYAIQLCYAGGTGSATNTSSFVDSDGFFGARVQQDPDPYARTPSVVQGPQEQQWQADITTDGATASGSATVDVTGSEASTPAATASGVAAVAVAVAEATNLEGPSLSSAVASAIAGAEASDLAAATLASIGAVAVAGAEASTTSSASASGVAQADVQAVGPIADLGASLSADAGVEIRASASAMADASMSGAATAEVAIGGTAQADDAAVASTAVVDVRAVAANTSEAAISGSAGAEVRGVATLQLVGAGIDAEAEASGGDDGGDALAEMTASTTVTLCYRTPAIAAGAIARAVLSRLSMPSAAKASLVSDPTTHIILTEIVRDSIDELAPAILAAALAGWTPP